MDAQNIIQKSTSFLIVMIQTNTKLGEENTVRIKMSDDETRIRVILSEASPLSDSPCFSMEPPFSWNNIPVKPPKLLFFFTSPDTNLLQHQRHYLLMQDAESSTNYSRYPSKNELKDASLCPTFGTSRWKTNKTGTKKRKVEVVIGNEKPISETFKWIAHGPSHYVFKYHGYVINGYHYHTKERDDLRAT
uniref:Uncharacterized protein n=1 Tax=Vitis vinifera TaxID=29760 RepID=A5BCH8_VITVI|nr:hypothetical protein VITISV_037349 [Vitis vinifera]